MKRIVLICVLLLVGCNTNSKELNNSDIKKLNKYIEKFEETINYNNETIQMMKAQNYGSSVYGDWEYYKDKKKEYENEYPEYYVTYKMMQVSSYLYDFIHDYQFYDSTLSMKDWIEEINYETELAKIARSIIKSTLEEGEFMDFDIEYIEKAYGINSNMRKFRECFYELLDDCLHDATVSARNYQNCVSNYEYLIEAYVRYRDERSYTSAAKSNEHLKIIHGVYKNHKEFLRTVRQAIQN